MEGILGIIVIIVAAVLSSQKKKKAMKTRPEPGPIVMSELQTQRALKNSAPSVSPLEMLEMEAMTHQEDRAALEEDGHEEIHLHAEQTMMPQLHETVLQEGEGGRRISAEIPAMEGAARKKTATQTENTEPAELEIAGLKLNGDEMMKAVVLSEILNRRPKPGMRRYS